MMIRVFNLAFEFVFNLFQTLLLTFEVRKFRTKGIKSSLRNYMIIRMSRY